MRRGTLRIRYKLRVTTRVRVQTRVTYTERTLAAARYVVHQAVSHRDLPDAPQLEYAVRALLPDSTDTDEVRDAVDAALAEIDEDDR